MYNLSIQKQINRRVLCSSILIFFIVLLFQPALAAGKTNSLSSPVRIAISNKNFLYVSDYNKKMVVVFKINKFNLKKKKEIKIGGFPLGLAVSNDKYIFVGNSSKNIVQVFRENGKYIFKFKTKAGKPNDIAISKNRDVYVVASDENLVKVYGFYGKLKFSFGGTGSAAGEFNFPTGIAIDEINGEVVVSDFLNKRVQIFDMNGNWLRSFGGGWFMSIVDRPQGISIDKNGNYHVVDVQQACVLVFDCQGSKISSYGKYGKDSGQLRTPLDIVLHKDGRAFVTSNLNKKIEIFREISK